MELLCPLVKEGKSNLYLLAKEGKRNLICWQGSSAKEDQQL